MAIKNKIAVTGGAGFIGSHLVKGLLEKGKKVVVIDDLSTGSIENLSNLGIQSSDFEFRRLNLANYGQALEAFEDSEDVFHLAARIGGIKYLHGSASIEALTLQENLAIDANVFRACQEQAVKRIVYTSSSAVYPMDRQYSFDTILSESDFSLEPMLQDPRFRFKLSVNPDGGYGLAKLLAEIQLSLMPDVKAGAARIFNVYGINEPLDERSHAISDLIRKAINYPEKEFIVWGDGRQTRDYVYVSDCVDALVKMMDKLIEEDKITGGNQQLPLVVNIGSGKPASIREIAEEAIKFSGKDIKPIYDLKKPVGPISRTADIKRAAVLLNWRPKTSLEDGLRRTYLWLQDKLANA